MGIDCRGTATSSRDEDKKRLLREIDDDTGEERLTSTVDEEAWGGGGGKEGKKGSGREFCAGSVFRRAKKKCRRDVRQRCSELEIGA